MSEKRRPMEPIKQIMVTDATGKKRPYQMCVLRVKSKTVVGTPRLLELIDDAEVITLSDNEEENEFMTCFLPVECLKGELS